MELTVSLNNLDLATRASVIKGLHHEDRAQHALGVLEQIRLKKMMDAAMAPGVNTEIGRTSMVMSAGQRLNATRQYGELCFADPDFAKFLLKHHPEFRVRDCGTRIQVGYRGAGKLQRRSAETPLRRKGK